MNISTQKEKLTYQRLWTTMWITYDCLWMLYPLYAQVIHSFVHICGKLHACYLQLVAETL